MLKVADNSKRKREDFNCIQNLVDHIADKKLEELGQEGAFVFSNGLSEIEGWSLELDEEQVIGYASRATDDHFSLLQRGKSRLFFAILTSKSFAFAQFCLLRSKYSSGRKDI